MSAPAQFASELQQLVLKFALMPPDPLSWQTAKQVSSSWRQDTLSLKFQHVTLYNYSPAPLKTFRSLCAAPPWILEQVVHLKITGWFMFETIPPLPKLKILEYDEPLWYNADWVEFLESRAPETWICSFPIWKTYGFYVPGALGCILDKRVRHFLLTSRLPY